MAEFRVEDYQGKWQVRRWEQGAGDGAAVTAFLALEAVTRQGRGNLRGEVRVPYAEAGTKIEMYLEAPDGGRPRAVGAITAPDIHGSFQLESGADPGVLLGNLYSVDNNGDMHDYRMSLERAEDLSAAEAEVRP